MEEPSASPVASRSSSSTSPGEFALHSLFPSTRLASIAPRRRLTTDFWCACRHDPPLSVALPHPPTSVSLHPYLRDRFIAGSTNDPWVRVYDLDTATERECYKGTFTHTQSDLRHLEQRVSDPRLTVLQATTDLSTRSPTARTERCTRPDPRTEPYVPSLPRDLSFLPANQD